MLLLWFTLVTLLPHLGLHRIAGLVVSEEDVVQRGLAVAEDGECAGGLPRLAVHTVQLRLQGAGGGHQRGPGLACTKYYLVSLLLSTAPDCSPAW